MYKKTITYTDFNGLERTEDFLFNFNKAELLEMEMSKDETLTGCLQRIINAKDSPEIMREVKNLILKSYGVKSEDGRYFIKNDEVRQKFECSEAYSTIFMELMSDDKKAAEFVNAIMPQEVLKEAVKEAGNNGSTPLLMPAT